MAQPVVLTFDLFASKYLETQEGTPDSLRVQLRDKVTRYQPDGFMLLRCEQLDSSWYGQHVILPYGPSNTYLTWPETPISPRGLASDMSVVVAIMPASEIQ